MILVLGIDDQSAHIASARLDAPARGADDLPIQCGFEVDVLGEVCTDLFQRLCQRGDPIVAVDSRFALVGQLLQSQDGFHIFVAGTGDDCLLHDPTLPPGCG